MKNRLHAGLRTTLVAAIVTVLGVAGTAFAAGKISGDEIRNNTITTQNVKNASLERWDLSQDARESLRGQRGPRGRRGPQGDPGVPGQDGQDGANGVDGAPGRDASYSGPNWGIVARNHIGSAVADLRSGPFASWPGEPAVEPPYGDGSLGIAVSDNALNGGNTREKAAFGNEVDFQGMSVLHLTAIGFHVFQTGENRAIAPDNLPNITLEIDPNLATSTSGYSSLVFLPAEIPAGGVNRWSGYIDATTSGQWYLTGAAGTTTGCSQSSFCTLDEVRIALNDGGDAPTIYTVQISKGRDNAWVGAVDGLRVNGTIYDFEPFGVYERAAQ